MSVYDSWYDPGFRSLPEPAPSAPTCSAKAVALMNELIHESAAVRRTALLKLAWANEACSLGLIMERAFYDSDRDIRIFATAVAGRVTASNVDIPGFALWALNLFGIMLNGSDEAVKPNAKLAAERVISALRTYETARGGSTFAKLLHFASKHRNGLGVLGLAALAAGAGYYYVKVRR